MVQYLTAFVVIYILVWAGRIALLLARVKIFKKQWLAGNMTKARANELVYVAMGDSTAQGIGSPSISKAYPSLIADWLQVQTSRPVKLINLSVTGAKISDVIKDQLPQLYRLPAPHIITVCIGANDVRGFNPERFESEVKLLLRSLPKDTYVGSVPTFTSGLGISDMKSKNDYKSKHASDIIVAELKNTNHHFVDIRQATSHLAGLKYHAADLFHPNSRSYKIIAGEFKKVIAARLPELANIKR